MLPLILTIHHLRIILFTYWAPREDSDLLLLCSLWSGASCQSCRLDMKRPTSNRYLFCMQDYLWSSWISPCDVSSSDVSTSVRKKPLTAVIYQLLLGISSSDLAGIMRLLVNGGSSSYLTNVCHSDKCPV